MGAIALAVGGCSATPTENAQTPDPTPAAPAVLAFEDSDPAPEPPSDTIASTATSASAPAASVLLDDGQAGAWQQITDDAVIGVHSAPDTVYTRLGVLEPGAGVVGTGRLADTGGTIWMEINWGEATAWVLAAAFAPAG